MKKLALLFCVIFTLIMLSACNEDSSNDNSTTDSKSDFSVKMVTDTSGVDDKSFNESAWEGLKKFEKDFGAEVGYLQSGSQADFLPNLTTLAREGTSLSLGVGFLMEDDVRTVALQYPDSNFAIVDAVIKDQDGNPIPNIANISFAEHEGSFLVGLIAGLQTNTNKVGFMVGLKVI